MGKDGTLDKFLHNHHVLEKLIQTKGGEDADKVPYWSSMHQYDGHSDWGHHEIRISSFTQSGRTHYFGVIQLGIADLVCRVPALASNTESLEIARRTLRQDTTSQYQRPIEFDRLNVLNEFLQQSPTIVNPVILHAPQESIDSGAVKFDLSTGTLRIDLQKCRYIERTKTDVDPQTGKDFRPIDIVDGQHRIRATRKGENGLQTTIPFILLDPGMNSKEAARVFAEINVQSEDLKPLYQLHL